MSHLIGVEINLKYMVVLNHCLTKYNKTVSFFFKEYSNQNIEACKAYNYKSEH